jgi:hypothetical protein
MMIKRALSHHDEPPVEIVQPGQSVKTAGALPAVQSFLDTLKPDPRYTYALVNAMGYSEFFGANSNADWYGLNPNTGYNGLLNAWDGIGQDIELDRMKGKQWSHGYPCFYNAAVYAHHRNSCPTTLGFGDVIFSFANPTMKRIELLMRTDNAEAKKKGHDSILAKISSERCDVSMGARVPYDTCSVCTDWATYKKAAARFDPQRHAHIGIAVLAYHKTVAPIRGLAITRADYCRCMRGAKNRVLPDGRKVFVYNDYPRFFDISFVYVGADRTARVMWHLGSVAEQKSALPFIAEHFLKSAGAEKRASMEKEIDAVAEKVEADDTTTPAVTFEALLGPGCSLPQILSSAGALGIVASPREFQNLYAHTRPPEEKIQLLRAPTFSTEQGGIDDRCGVSPGQVLPALLTALLAIAKQRSSFAPFLLPRLEKQEKVAAAPCRAPTVSNPKLAALYNGYRISLLEKCGALAIDPSTLNDPLGIKISSAEALGALLLGIAPMLHLVSSHLRQQADEGKQLGSMAQFIAEHPTFSSLTALGAGVRCAMIAEQGGLLPLALKLLAAAKT